MHNLQQLNSLPGDQRGATLFVALVLLVLISLIGVATLKSATVVEKLSSSDYQKNLSFQASESAAITSLKDTENMTAIFGDAPVSGQIDIETNIENTSAKVRYAYVGKSVIEGASIGSVVGQQFTITSDGQITGDANASTTRTVHGMLKIVPAL